MRKVVAFSKVALLTRVSVACVLAASVSACGTDSVRLAENPFSNPFSSSKASKSVADPASTGSISKTSAQTGSTGTGLLGGSKVTSAPLAPLASAKPLASTPARAAATAVTPRPVAALTSPATTGSLARPAATVGSVAGWSASGGTPVTLAHGESVDTLSGRYGVPAAAILAANGLPKGASITPGTKVVIPVYNAASKAGGTQVAQNSSFSSDMARNTPTPPAPVTSAVEGAKEKARLASEAKAKSETQARIEAAESRAAAAEARANAATKSTADSTSKAQALKTAADAKAKSDAAAKVVADLKAKEKLADAKAKATETKTKTVETKATTTDAAAAKAKLAAETKLKAEEKLKTTAEAKAKAEAKTKTEAKAKAEAKALADARTKQGTKVASVAVEEPKTTASVAKEEPAKAPSADFRWPARGRVITGFSGKGGNEGINIAVPEGTPVKAAEGGTVAYSGNELKGYGNLVLIRHDNGYVSAYAHNGDINVKRGEKVSRGQVIAKSGQSGNVSSPQLHFELRKGSSPVDPMPYLEN